MTDDGIAGEAHDLVYGARAATYGHPRFDFTAIAKVWTGLLQDKLKDDSELDPYRVAVMMTGLKLCRLVKSPGHHDSRVDTIGYMLAMERLDEPETTLKLSDLRSADEIHENDMHDPEYEREYDKLLGRETSEHSQQLDAEEDDAEFKALMSGELADVVSGRKSAEDILFDEGDRIETLNGSLAWLFGYGWNLWYPDRSYTPCGFDELPFGIQNPQTLYHLRIAESPLRVTSGAYKGLLIFKDGVGYAP